MHTADHTLGFMNAREEPRIRVLVADDHPLVREGLRYCLHGRYLIVGEASNGQQAVTLARELAPDVVVMDATMPVMDGLEAARGLRAACPGTRIVMLTEQESPEFLRELVQSGVRGCVRKTSPPEEIISAIERVHGGELFFKPDVAQDFFREYVLKSGKLDVPSSRRLSPREQEALS